MHPEPRDPVRDEQHIQAMSRNAFGVTMVGAVAFLLACLSVLAR